MDTKDFTFEIKAVDEQGVFEGALSVYNIVDEGGDVVEPGAFTKTLQEGGGVVPLLWQHDAKQPIGTLELRDSPTALLAKGKLVLAVPKAREAYELLKGRALRGLSIGYKAVKQAIDPSGEIRRLKELRLFEGSLVSVPMNPAAVVTAVKSQEPDPDMEAIEAFRNVSRDLRDFHRRLIED